MVYRSHHLQTRNFAQLTYLIWRTKPDTASEVTILWLDRNEYIITRPHRMHSEHNMRHITTDGVAWSVCLSLPGKTAEPIEMPFVGPRNHVLDEVTIGRIHSQLQRVTSRRCGILTNLNTLL